MPKIPKPEFVDKIPKPEFVNNIPMPEIASSNFDIGPTVEQFRAQADGVAPFKGLGIRGVFRVAILIVASCAFIALLSISFINVTNDSLAKAGASIHSEANYLCLQLESLGTRANAFNKLADSLGASKQELESKDPDGYRLLSDPVGDILSGYTLAETGTVAIIANGVIISSDDKRVPVGSNVQTLLGDEVCAAIDASLADDQMQPIPYCGVFDEPGGPGAWGDNDEEAYLLAAQQGDYTIMIIEPMEMVFRERNAILAREAFVAFIILILVSAIVDRLLSFIVARRIDRTNEALFQITEGNLDTRVEDKGTREFKSLATGINITVEALQGWIAEAESRMDSELAAARAIQESALPRTFPPYPDIPKFDLYAIMNAAREVGGDFYDFFLVGESGPDSGKLAFLIADVSGKGVPASLFMMKAAAQVRSELQSGLGLSQAIENVNAELADGNDACMFVTMWVGILDYETGHVDYVNAGHNPPLLWREDTGWSWLKDKSGMPLGLITGSHYRACSLECQVGDKFLLYTDGVSEAMNVDGTLFGEERLEVVANANSDKHPVALVKAVRQEVADFALGAEQSDDITILALELGTPSE